MFVALRRFLPLFLVSFASIAFPPEAWATQQLWQANASGTDIDIFDTETGARIDRLEVGPNPYGIAAAGRTVFVSLENRGGGGGALGGGRVLCCSLSGGGERLTDQGRALSREGEREVVLS